MQKLIPVAFIALLLLFGCTTQEKAKEGPKLVLGEDLKTVEEEKTGGAIPVQPELQSPPEPKINLFQVFTDKGSYVSRDVITVRARINVQGEIPGTVVEVYGIANSLGRQLLYQNKLLYLKDGESEMNVTFELPYCAVCSGMPQGTYYIYANASKANRTLALANCSFNFSAG